MKNRKNAILWGSRILAGCGLGFLLALFMVGCFRFATPDGPGKLFLTVWIFTLFWMAMFSAAFFFSAARQCWLWLGGLTLLAFLLMEVSRSFARIL